MPETVAGEFRERAGRRREVAGWFGVPRGRLRLWGHFRGPTRELPRVPGRKTGSGSCRGRFRESQEWFREPRGRCLERQGRFPERRGRFRALELSLEPPDRLWDPRAC